MNTSRRSFITTAAIGTLASLSIPEIAAAAFAEGNGRRVSLIKMMLCFSRAIR